MMFRNWLQYVQSGVPDLDKTYLEWCVLKVRPALLRHFVSHCSSVRIQTLPQPLRSFVGYCSIFWLILPFVMLGVTDMWAAFMANKHLAYGVGPMITYASTYVFMAVFLEWLTAQPFMEKYLIRYSAGVCRATALEKTRKIASFDQQFSNVVGNLMGVGGLLSGGVIYVVAFVIGRLEAPTDLFPPSVVQAVLQFVVMELFGDFLLYWGHRIQHDNTFLYTISHSFHHTLETPTPLGTGYVKTLDGILQHALPVAILMATVRPHPLTLYLYIMSRIGESVWNHSGIDHAIVDLITFKFLPFRAPIAHHDAHHKYSSYSKNAKNFGEAFWIWDYVFGTYSAYRNVRVSAQKKAK